MDEPGGHALAIGEWWMMSYAAFSTDGGYQPLLMGMGLLGATLILT